MLIAFLIIVILICLFTMLLMANYIEEQRKIIYKYEHRDKFPQTKWFSDFLSKQFNKN